ncbi:DUF6150 family protein [Aureibacter tunicatorum]|uniref:7(1) septoil knot domain-containing protein n=1 Tax=Aureibacter tunicatorum TaxID=866807 RepID=A0AAE3XKD6_9BACT|nr:DUF6150 family protein [Aureibacter tunicatorum]MDR6237614.1 hypothetical protein [Aureibacter tunicatorum]BDD02649.1 hypothetical protein AUTU_01320 [Aureibacter tunicatorum]
MKKILFSLFIILLSFATGSFAQSRLDACNVFGRIFIAVQPSYAQFLIYEEETEGLADLIVYEEDNKLYADEQGKWFFVDVRAFAEYTVYFVEDRDKAHFTVYFTDEPGYAGCNN